ncbi:zinc-dependent alcohol dehydrogenase family protein [Rhodovibrio salinarum]|uniref:Alcohol dehydrogenase n=1 Tax=Rhodovibrio salinarum TaxID=1087 RepID=A0A934QFT1_9PROT|nr:zinc-dependent alcohol dehydrogenase family protein [Rhodovibrio salinarum]MBK1695837.1 alcohol dehydrogenase [Rhodovibrio salinarum]
MKAAIFENFRTPPEVREVPDPDCPADGALVRVHACGVCRSDWHAWTGSDPDVVAPHVGGHEFAGVVERVGRHVERVRPGDRVTAPFILSCGRCQTCRGGDATACDRQDVIGFTRWGSFAELVAVPRADFNMVALPDQLPAVAAAGMGCRVTTAFRALADRARLQPGEWLVVHGCGGVGLSAVALGAAMGARVLAVDIDAAALERADALGATRTLNAGSVDEVGHAVRTMTDGGAQVSLDALGITETFRNSLYSLAKLGRHVQIGMPLDRHAEPPVPLLELVYARQIAILGTRGMAAGRFDNLFGLIAGGRFDPSLLVERTIPLSGVADALAAMNGYTSPGVTVIDRFDA